MNPDGVHIVIIKNKFAPAKSEPTIHTSYLFGQRGTTKRALSLSAIILRMKNAIVILYDLSTFLIGVES